MEKGGNTRSVTACSQCARAKVRCHKTQSTAVESPCDRCLRLKKDCAPQRTVARADPVPRTRFGKLEQKVEAIFQRLEEQSQSRISNSARGTEPRIKPTVVSKRRLPPRPQRNIAPSPLQNGSSRSGRMVPDAPIQQPVPHVTIVEDSSLWPSDDDVTPLLEAYEDKMGGAFPFVVIPQQSVQRLRQSRPYLLKAVVTAAAHKDRELQRRRAVDFITSLSKAILIDGEKSLDILQALLIHLAWYQCHMPRNTQITILLQLAIAMVGDLELNKPTHANDRRKSVFDGARSSYGFSSEVRILTNEERRALLACYYLSSTGSTVYRKIDALAYTNHMEEQLQILLSHEEYHGDVLLAELVRLQRIVQDITQIVPYDEPHRPRSFGMPFLMHLKSLDRSLQDYENSLPEILKKHDFLLMHLHTARIFLYEVGLYEMPWADTAGGERLNALLACSSHLRAFFETFFKFPGEAFLVLPYSLWGQLAHALLITSRLCLLDYQGWSDEFIDEEMRICAVLDRCKYKLEDANHFARQGWLFNSGDLIIDKVQMKFGWMKRWYEEYTLSKQDQVSQTESGQLRSKLVAGGQMEKCMLDDCDWEDVMTSVQFDGEDPVR